MYLVRNKRTKDFIDDSGDWTLIRSFAKKFTSKDEAQKFIDKHQTKNDDPYMEIVSEGVQKHLKEYLAESKKTIKQQIKDMLGFEPVFIDKQAKGYRVSLGKYRTDKEKDAIIKSFSKEIKDNNLIIRTGRAGFCGSYVDAVIPFDRIEK
jgi:hypothetical protein